MTFGMILWSLICFLAGSVFGAILASHSAKMRYMAKTVDDEFRAAQAAMQAKLAAAQAAPKPTGPTVEELAAQLKPSDPPKP